MLGIVTFFTLALFCGSGRLGRLIFVLLAEGVGVAAGVIAGVVQVDSRQGGIGRHREAQGGTGAELVTRS